MQKHHEWNGLKVCQSCGWPMAGPMETERHLRDCEHIAQGEAADVLASELPGIVGTKYGYGTDKVTFEIAPGAHVTLRIGADRTFQLDTLFMLDTLETSQAIALVKGLAAAMREIRGQQRVIDTMREMGRKP